MSLFRCVARVRPSRHPSGGQQTFARLMANHPVGGHLATLCPFAPRATRLLATPSASASSVACSPFVRRNSRCLHPNQCLRHRALRLPPAASSSASLAVTSTFRPSSQATQCCRCVRHVRPSTASSASTDPRSRTRVCRSLSPPRPLERRTLSTRRPISQVGVTRGRPFCVQPPRVARTISLRAAWKAALAARASATSHSATYGTAQGRYAAVSPTSDCPMAARAHPLRVRIIARRHRVTWPFLSSTRMHATRATMPSARVSSAICDSAA